MVCRSAPNPKACKADSAWIANNTGRQPQATDASGVPLCARWLCNKTCPRMQRAEAHGVRLLHTLGRGPQPLPSSPPVSLVVIIPWLEYNKGKREGVAESRRPPGFFDLWATSAGANAGLADFLLPCVRPFPRATHRPLPPNVRFHQVEDRSVLGGNSKHEYITNRKPTWGHVFRALIGNYSHWAWGDMDVILGDLRRFVTVKPACEMNAVSSPAEPALGCSGSGQGPGYA